MWAYSAKRAARDAKTLTLQENRAKAVIAGEKPENERFPGADNTYSIEAMMQDGKALQAGTSHYLGTSFAQAQNIRFQNEAGEHVWCHTTSWGVSTRLIGGVIMNHGDDDGLRLPPAIAPRQIVIVPMLRGKAAYGCSRFREDCQFRVPLELCGRTLTEAQIAQLLRRGKTGIIRGFTSQRTGQKFEAALQLAGDKVEFVFEKK